MNFPLIAIGLLIASVVLLLWFFFAAQRIKSKIKERESRIAASYINHTPIIKKNYADDLSRPHEFTAEAQKKFQFKTPDLTNFKALLPKEKSEKDLFKQKLIQFDPAHKIIKIHSLTDHGFRGYELFQALQDVGLEYDEKNCFNYCAPDGKTLFQLILVSDSHKNEFDLLSIGAYQTNELVCVLKTDFNLENFQIMEDIAEVLCEELGGKISE